MIQLILNLKIKSKNQIIKVIKMKNKSLILDKTIQYVLNKN